MDLKAIKQRLINLDNGKLKIERDWLEIQTCILDFYFYTQATAGKEFDEIIKTPHNSSNTGDVSINTKSINLNNQEVTYSF